MLFRLGLCLLLALLVACGPGHGLGPSAGAVSFEVISKGEVVELANFVASDRITVFDFYADWCAPCKQVDKSLTSLKSTYGDKLQVYKLDLVNWESALAKHHGINQLPYLIVFDRGEEMLQGPANRVLPNLVKALNGP